MLCSDFSKRVKPLYQLLKEEKVSDVKKDYDVPFYIICDASTTQLGAVLIPKTAGIDRVIGYASQGLT